MTAPANAYLRHQQSRWLRPDAARWVRPDAKRFLAPNADVLAAFPGLERKYNPNQPRVPAGSPQGGQWTDEDQEIQGDSASDPEAVDWTESLTSILQESGTLRPRVIIDTTNWDKDSDQEIRKEVDSLNLFSIGPGDRRISGIRLAGDPPGIGDNGGPPLDEPPQIPKEMPDTRKDRMKFVRNSIRWMSRIGRASPLVDAFIGAAREVDEIKRLTDMIRTANDPPRELNELIERAEGPSQPGYEKHHIAEQEAARKAGYPESMIQRRDNIVLVPTAKHLDITADYLRKVEQPDGTIRSLRDFLSDKDFETRQEVGRQMLRKHGVLK